jgi:hypothetical protein
MLLAQTNRDEMVGKDWEPRSKPNSSSVVPKDRTRTAWGNHPSCLLRRGQDGGGVLLDCARRWRQGPGKRRPSANPNPSQLLNGLPQNRH